MRYKIMVKVLQGNVITFTVDSYEIDEGGFIKFKDRVTKKTKRFHSSNCEIEEVNGNYDSN